MHGFVPTNRIASHGGYASGGNEFDPDAVGDVADRDLEPGVVLGGDGGEDVVEEVWWRTWKRRKRWRKGCQNARGGYRHLRHFHHIYFKQCVERLTGNGFSLNPTSSSLISGLKHSALFVAGNANMSAAFDVTSDYECPICLKTGLRDFGLHLLLGHDFFYCYHCSGFFGSLRERDRHLKRARGQDEVSHGCSICGTKFENLAMLLGHRNTAHNMSNCLLCHKLVFTSQKRFAQHWKAHNKFVHLDLPYDDLVGAVLMESDGGAVKCGFCFAEDAFVQPLHSGNDQEEDPPMSLMQHLVDEHSVHSLSPLVFAFDGQTFRLTNLIGRERLATIEIEGEDKKKISKSIFRERRTRPPRPFPCSFCARCFDSLDAVDFHIATQQANRGEKKKRSKEEDGEGIVIDTVEGEDKSCKTHI
jgi:hypothetical protein